MMRWDRPAGLIDQRARSRARYARFAAAVQVQNGGRSEVNPLTKDDRTFRRFRRFLGPVRRPVQLFRFSNRTLVREPTGCSMAGTHTHRMLRFELVNLGHHFLIDVLPLLHPESQEALTRFTTEVATCPLPQADVDAVLLRCLTVLDAHTGGRLPTLVDRYVSTARHIPNCVSRFNECVSDVLKYRGIANVVIQKAIAVIDERYRDSTLTQESVALAVGLRPPVLSGVFKRETRATFSDYLRNVRLNHAAALLVTTTMSIKEVWSHVGYNYPSNFDHDFKRRFGQTPREYRSRAIYIKTEEIIGRDSYQMAVSSQRSETGRTVLVADDDDVTRTTIERFLTLDGYHIVTASTGEKVLEGMDQVLPDAALLDYHLPDMTGVECLRQLRRRHGSGPAVALFTADWGVYDEADEVHALDAIIVSKLCDLEAVRDLAVYLCRR